METAGLTLLTQCLLNPTVIVAHGPDGLRYLIRYAKVDSFRVQTYWTPDIHAAYVWRDPVVAAVCLRRIRSCSPLGARVCNARKVKGWVERTAWDLNAMKGRIPG